MHAYDGAQDVAETSLQCYLIMLHCMLTTHRVQLLTRVAAAEQSTIWQLLSVTTAALGCRLCRLTS